MEVIMSELKKGDIVEMTTGLYKSIYAGDKLEIISSSGDMATLNHRVEISKKHFKKVEGFKMDYETSNRKKLKDAVIKTGFSSKDLSIAMGFNDNYLSGYISKSRMSERGDISEEQLHSILASLNFAVDGLSHFNEVKNADKLKFGDAKFECSSNITEADKKEINVETEIDSEFQFIGGGYDPVFDTPESKSTTSETQYHVTNNYAPKYSNFIKLQKLAFAVCFIMVILLISILYFVVSK